MWINWTSIIIKFSKDFHTSNLIFLNFSQIDQGKMKEIIWNKEVAKMTS